MSCNLTDKEISLEILKLLIEKNSIPYEDFPEEKTYTDVICRSYEKILKCVNESYETIIE